MNTILFLLIILIGLVIGMMVGFNMADTNADLRMENIENDIFYYLKKCLNNERENEIESDSDNKDEKIDTDGKV